MENAAKALLIAGGILIGLIIVSIMVMGYNEITDYYESKESAQQGQQLDSFNKQYTPYNRDSVRGSDLLSLINKIVDFNLLKEDQEPMQISIIIPSNIESSKNFYYKYDEYSTQQKLVNFGTTTNPSYTHANINAMLVSKANAIEIKYTQAVATKLANNISTLMGDNTRKTPDELFDELNIDPNDYYNNNAIINIQRDILKYYQYIQFKRAHFDCKELNFSNTGRVQSFRFEFQGKFE